MAQNRLLKRGSVYYFRARVPHELQTYFGRREIRRSLGTRDYQEACRLARELSVEFDRDCAKARALRSRSMTPPRPVILDDALIQEVCTRWHQAALEGDEIDRRQGRFLDPEEFQETRQNRSEVLEIMREALPQGRTEVIQPALKQFLDCFLHIEPIGDEEAMRRLAYAFHQQMLVTHELQMKRDAGEVVPTPPPSSTAGTPGQELCPLDRLYEDWKAFDPNRAPYTLSEVRRVLDDFKRHTGLAHAHEVQREHISDYLTHLLSQGKSPKTVEKMIGFLKALFNAGINSGRINRNPAQRMRMPRDTRSRSRLPFATEDLQALFRGPVHSEGKPMGRNYRDAAFWIPVLALYHGCRLEEIAQLLVEDVVRQDGVACLRIDDYSETDARKRLKNSASRRTLPLHPKVVELGFLEYVTHQQAQGARWLFLELKAGRHEKRGAAFGRAFMRYLRQTIGITDPRKVFHSFRHTFRSACREAGLDEEISDALMGHAGDGRMGRRYGAGFSVRRLQEAISRIEYPGVEIPMPAAPNRDRNSTRHELGVNAYGNARGDESTAPSMR